MNEAVITPDVIAVISVAVTGVTQIVKTAGFDKKHNLAIVMVMSLLAIIIWVYSNGGPVTAYLFNYFSSWILVTTSSMGIHSAQKTMTEPKEETSTVTITKETSKHESESD